MAKFDAHCPLHGRVFVSQRFVCFRGALFGKKFKVGNLGILFSVTSPQEVVAASSISAITRRDDAITLSVDDIARTVPPPLPNSNGCQYIFRSVADGDDFFSACTRAKAKRACANRRRF
jgi:hypothetical protein